jgi:DNA-binding CsgD family transcriptional regulator
MDTPSALERGRSAYAGRRWLEAVEQLAEADRDGGLEAADLERLGTACVLTGRLLEGVDYLARAQTGHLSSGGLCDAARCAWSCGMQLTYVGERARASGWFARAQRLVDQISEPCVVEGFLLIPAALGAMYGGDPQTGLEYFAQAATVAQRFGNPDLTALAQLGQGQALIMLDRTEEGIALHDEVMVAVTAGEVSPIPSGIVYCAVIDGCHSAFDLRRAQEWTAALDHWCATQPDLVAFSGRCQMHRAELFRLHCAWDDAMLAAQQAAERARRGDRTAMPGGYYQQGEVHRLRGNFDAAATCYAKASEFGFEPQPGLALLRLALGKRDAAQSMMRRTLQDTKPGDRRNLLSAAVDIELAAGDVVAAQALVTELGRLNAGNPKPLLEAMAGYAEAAVLLAEGDAQAALTRSRTAWRAWLELDAPYEAARCRLLAGLACRKLGDEDSALMEFDAARAVFVELGARPALADLEHVTGAAGTAEIGLSARELEVLRAVAAGKTNRTIAGELFLSQKTVDRHVSNIFTKIGVSSRAAATAYAYQQKLI